MRDDADLKPLHDRWRIFGLCQYEVFQRLRLLLDGVVKKLEIRGGLDSDSIGSSIT